ncbi:glycosyltransferase family 2 protein [Kosakonia cowanii]|uniref:glycosyltransferase family 2 protein n=1 Tax=Kosakonia cowanii TaxID=208223 RepID=UPI003EE6297E
MHDRTPLVTIVIPSYNHAQFIERAIISVFNQTYKNIEIIFIDDGSKDATKEIVEKLQQSFSFKAIFQKNMGLSATLNKAIDMANGEYFSVCSSDDMYYSNKVEKQVMALNNEPASPCVVAKASVVDDDDCILPIESERYNSGLSGDITFEELFTFKTVLPVTCMYRLDVLRQVGGFDSSLAAEDYDMSLKLSSRYKLIFIDEPLYYYRSPAAIGGTRKRRPMRLDVSEAHLTTINKFRDHPFYDQAILEWNFRRFILFSKYIDTKRYALSGALRCKRKMFHKMYVRSLIKLVFLWIK